MPAPQKEHEWLKKFVGDWDLELEMITEPGQPPSKSTGSDHVRMLGGFWLISHGQNNNFPYSCQLTLGFDPRQGKYVGTWCDSMSSHLWHYVGSVDSTGRILTLNTEGPFPDGTMTKFREVTEFKTDDHRVFTSSRLADGKWVTQMTIHFHRRAGKA